MLRISEEASRTLDKREYLLIIRNSFCLFCIKTYVVTSHLNRLDETVQMKGYQHVQKNFNGSNTFRTMKSCSRQGVDG